MNYCSQCGGTVSFILPPGDDHERYVCNQCGVVHYQNPKVVTGCFITHKQRVLLCRRAIAPECGMWTLPAGFMENGETTEQAAVRESWEEARARVKSQGLYAVINLPQINQVYLFYRGELDGFNVGDPGHESCEVGLFSESEVPWEQLAFPSVVDKMLKNYFEDCRTGDFSIKTFDVENLPLWSPEQHAETVDVTPWFKREKGPCNNDSLRGA